MADPFEVRIRFSSQLQHLNASVVSAQKASQYALKYRDMSEDLHSCILEQLEKNSMNTRANIMYFIEPFLELCSSERSSSAQDYVRRMQRDIIRVVDAVCPEDGSGAANVKVVRKVLTGLCAKKFLSQETVDEIEECLKDRALAGLDGGSSPPLHNGGGGSGRDAAAAMGAPDSEIRNGIGGPLRADRNSVVAPVKLEKRQIEQRIEEDRERHKKRRENMWVVPKDPDEKRAKLWDQVSDAGEDDYRMGAEDQEELGVLRERRNDEGRERRQENRKTWDRDRHRGMNGRGQRLR